ncbi:MAG: AraC family transcriptional regulator [Chryseolinea sp.]
MKNIPIRKIKATQKEPTASQSFCIRDIGVLLSGKDMLQELHRHDFFYILALKKGKGVHEIDFIPYRVRDHSIFFMRPGQVHQHTLKAGSSGYLIEFKTDFYPLQDNVFNQQLRKVSGRNLYEFSAPEFKALSFALTHIFEEYMRKQEGYLEVIKANLAILFIELSRRQGRTAVSNVSRYTQERLDKFLELLEKHVAIHKQPTRYAEMLNLSLYQLNAITKEMLGKTCSEVINEHIVLESKRYLLATSNQIGQIGNQLGYDDVSYFIRFFKKQTGHSPEVFRNNFK